MMGTVECAGRTKMGAVGCPWRTKMGTLGCAGRTKMRTVGCAVRATMGTVERSTRREMADGNVRRIIIWEVKSHGWKVVKNARGFGRMKNHQLMFWFDVLGVGESRQRHGWVQKCCDWLKSKR